LTVVSVVHPTFSEVSHELFGQMAAEREAHIRLAAGDDAELVLREGEAAPELIRFASGAHPDLLVVGRHDSMALGGFGDEGLFESLLRHYPLPFAIVPDRAPLPPPAEPMTIVVGVDGSDANAESVRLIGELSKSIGARTIPVFAVLTMASTTRNHYGSRLVHQSEAEDIASQLPDAEPLQTPNEDPVRGVLDVVGWEKADLIAVGTRGHRSFGDLFSGQYVRHLVDHAPVAVLVAPHHHD
jgi:nucleotide-binding universal stress UspA family protein